MFQSPDLEPQIRHQNVMGGNGEGPHNSVLSFHYFPFSVQYLDLRPFNFIASLVHFPHKLNL